MIVRPGVARLVGGREPLNTLEEVGVTLDIEHSRRRGDIEVVLISPSNTASRLARSYTKLPDEMSLRTPCRGNWPNSPYLLLEQCLLGRMAGGRMDLANPRQGHGRNRGREQLQPAPAHGVGDRASRVSSV